MIDSLESLKAKEPTHEFEDLLPQLALLQKGLTHEGIETLVGGGVGTDLLIVKYLPGMSPRKHSDVDLYISIRLRGKTLNWMKNNGYKVDGYSSKNASHAITYINGVKYDIFSIDRNSSNAWVANPSATAILAQQQTDGTIHERHIPINTQPDIVKYHEKNYRVMDASSQLSLLNNLSPLLVNRRDLDALRNIAK